MKRWLTISLVGIAFITGGCEGAREEEKLQPSYGEKNGGNHELADQELGKAVEDESTRDFLVSTEEEEEEGFYRMRGELDWFEMGFRRKRC